MMAKGVRTIVYEWKIPKYPVGAQMAGEELERIEKRHGMVTPPILVAESTVQTSVLHPLFEWDDTKAAQRHRLSQARDILDNIVVVRFRGRKIPQPVRAYVNIVQMDNGKRGYTSMARALSHEDYTRQMLEAALADFKALKRKYGMLVELAALFEMVDLLAEEYGE